MKNTTESSSSVLCPSCGNQLTCDIFATVPSEQRLKMKLTSESRYFAADTIGEAICAQSNILKEVAKCLDTNVCVFVSNITTAAYEIEIEFLITTVK